MAVTPLTSPPTPPNSNLSRAMYVWVTSNSSQDPLGTDTNQQNLINFCGTQGVNVLFLDIWLYLGGSNWTTAKVNKMKQFLDLAHKSGVKVMALCGSTDWAINQAWVATNVTKRLADYQSLATLPTHRFDGVMLDVEYWTDGAQTADVSCPALCDLMSAMRHTLNIPVGCFTAFYLKDSDGSRPTLTYKGVIAQDGEHLMAASDFVSVGTYRDHANDNGTDGPGQITFFQPWYDVANDMGKNYLLWAGSETINVSPAYITYYGASKASMETEHTLISTQFRVAANSVFMGQAVHSYDGWKAMT